jgi:hypothetical protein
VQAREGSQRAVSKAAKSKGTSGGKKKGKRAAREILK